MPRVKLAVPDLEAMLLGRAVQQKRTDTEMAAVIGVTRPCYSRYKKNLLDHLSYRQTIAVCKYLGVSLEEFASTVRLPHSAE